MLLRNRVRWGVLYMERFVLYFEKVEDFVCQQTNTLQTLGDVFRTVKGTLRNLGVFTLLWTT